MNSLVRHTIGSRFLGKMIGSCFGHYATIFTLHRTAPTNGAFEGATPEFLESCLAYAKRKGFEFASVDELVNKALNGESLEAPTLCFTLDDGFADQLNALVPVLLKYDAKPTLFVITDLVDQIDWPWDAKLAYIMWNSKAALTEFVFDDARVAMDLSSLSARKDSRRRLTRFAKGLPSADLERFMLAAQTQLQVALSAVPPELYAPSDWERLRHYEKQGLRIGSHGRSHHVFNALDDKAILAELDHANTRLAAEIANPSRVFCYPSGTLQDFSSRHEPLVKKAGFLGAVSTISQCITLRDIHAAPFRIQRIGFPQKLDMFIRYSSWFEFLRGKMAG